MDKLNKDKIKKYINSKYVWAIVWGTVCFGLGVYHVIVFRFLIRCLICAGGILIFYIFCKIVNKIYEKRIKEENIRYGFDCLTEFKVYKKMIRKDTKDDGIPYVAEYSDWKERIQKNYDTQKENEDFWHFLIQKKRDTENMRKQNEIIAIPVVVLAATLIFEVLQKYRELSGEEAAIVILALIMVIAFLAAREIQRWRAQEEFLEDVMQVLEEKK